MQELKTSFVLREAPREVPLPVHVRARLGGTGQLGWFLLGFGSIFAWGFAGNADVSFLRGGGVVTDTQGIVTAIEETSFSEGGSDHSDGTPVYAYSFEFETPDGAPQRGTSYRTGRGPAEGARVTIEYDPDAPDAARIKGMRRAPFSAFVLFVLILPLAGVVLIAVRWRKGGRAMHLLKNGHLALGKLVSKTATNTRVNKRTVYRLTFEYEANDGRVHQAVTKTHQPEQLEDDAVERLLYDPALPDRAAMMDTLPGQVRISEAGQVERGGALLVLLLPFVTIAGNMLYLAFLYS